MENNRHKWVTQVVISLDCNIPTLVVLTITVRALWKKALGVPMRKWLRQMKLRRNENENSSLPQGIPKP